MEWNEGGTNLYVAEANLFRLDKYIFVNNTIYTREHSVNIEDNAIIH